MAGLGPVAGMAAIISSKDTRCGVKGRLPWAASLRKTTKLSIHSVPGPVISRPSRWWNVEGDG
jgi:hypothetical protein